MSRWYRNNYPKLIDLEKAVKDQIIKDKSSGDLYLAIKELSAMILISKKWARDYDEVENMSHMMAVDFYYKVQNGWECYCWTRYLTKCGKGYMMAYLNERSRVHISIDDVIDVHRYIEDLYASSDSLNSSAAEYSMSELDDMISQFPKYFWLEFDEIIRYRRDTDEYRNIKISTKMTILNRLSGRIGDSDTILYRLDPSYSSYIKMLINLANRKLGKYILDTCESRDPDFLTRYDNITKAWNNDNCS